MARSPLEPIIVAPELTKSSGSLVHVASPIEEVDVPDDPPPALVCSRKPSPNNAVRVVKVGYPRFISTRLSTSCRESLGSI